MFLLSLVSTFEVGGDGILGSCCYDFAHSCSWFELQITQTNNEMKGLLHRAIPKEMFDPNGHAMDTTYLDADLRIVRLTGPNHEGVRNIFIRKGSITINPVESA